MIYVNQVLQYTLYSQRISIINIEEPIVYVVNIDTISTMPIKELYSKLLVEIENEELLIITDPFSKTILESDLTKIQIKKRNEDWSIVEKFIIPNMDELLKKNGREAKITEIS